MVSYKFSGEAEIDESYFGAKKGKIKRDRVTANKTPVLGMLKRDSKVVRSTLR